MKIALIILGTIGMVTVLEGLWALLVTGKPGRGYAVITMLVGIVMISLSLYTMNSKIGYGMLMCGLSNFMWGSIVIMFHSQRPRPALKS